jgi:hypothetical protein
MNQFASEPEDTDSPSPAEPKRSHRDVIFDVVRRSLEVLNGSPSQSANENSPFAMIDRDLRREAISAEDPDYTPQQAFAFLSVTPGVVQDVMESFRRRSGRDISKEVRRPVLDTGKKLLGIFKSARQKFNPFLSPQERRAIRFPVQQPKEENSSSTAESETSETPSPKAVAPEAVSPEAVSPEAVSPEAVSPEAVSPEAPPSSLADEPSSEVPPVSADPLAQNAASDPTAPPAEEKLSFSQNIKQNWHSGLTGLGVGIGTKLWLFPIVAQHLTSHAGTTDLFHAQPSVIAATLVAGVIAGAASGIASRFAVAGVQKLRHQKLSKHWFRDSFLYGSAWGAAGGFAGCLVASAWEYFHLFSHAAPNAPSSANTSHIPVPKPRPNFTPPTAHAVSHTLDTARAYARQILTMKVPEYLNKEALVALKANSAHGFQHFLKDSSAYFLNHHTEVKAVHKMFKEYGAKLLQTGYELGREYNLNGVVDKMITRDWGFVNFWGEGVPQHMKAGLELVHKSGKAVGGALYQHLRPFAPSLSPT